MLYSEFCEMYSAVSVSGDGYKDIEKSYYGWYGDKRQFCDILTIFSDNREPEMIDCFLATCYYADRNNEPLPYRYAVYADDSDLGIHLSSNSMYRFELSALIKAKQLNGDTPFYWVILCTSC